MPVDTGAGAFSQERIRAIINKTMKSFVEGDAFLKALRKAVRESVSTEVTALLQRIEVNESKIMDLETRIQAQSAEISNLRKSFDQKNEVVNSLQRRLFSQEQYSRRSCLRFYGTDESPNENTDDIICSIANDTLKIPMNLNDIERSHRVGPTPKNAVNADGLRRSNRTSSASNNKTQPKPRPIIVKFVLYRTRKLVISKRSALKGSKRGFLEGRRRGYDER